jgi:hypothetical protein
MMTTTILSKPARLLLSLICIAVLLPCIAQAQVAGKLTKISGRVDILRAGAAAAVPVKVNEEVSIGDIVRTKSDGTAEITFIDNSVMTLGPSSRLGIEEYLFKSEDNKRVASVKLHRGKAGFTVPKPVYAAEGSKFEMKTRTAVAGVRGTDGLLFTGPIERVYVRAGIVAFWTPLGLVIVPAGNVGEVFFGNPPQVRPYSGNEYRRQDVGVTSPKPPLMGGAPAPPPPPQLTESQLAIITAPPIIITPPLTPPLTVTESTGTATQPKTTPVNVNVNFPNTVNINVR